MGDPQITMGFNTVQYSTGPTFWHDLGVDQPGVIPEIKLVRDFFTDLVDP